MLNCERIIIAGDRITAATISSRLGTWGTYIPVLDPPRPKRLDFDTEVLRRINLLKLARSTTVVQAGLPGDIITALNRYLSPSQVEVVDIADAERYQRGSYEPREVLTTSPSSVLAGLYCALRQNRVLSIRDGAKSVEPDNAFPSNHIVVVEDHEAVGSVAAVNYAALVGAHLAVVPARTRVESDRIIFQLRQFDDAKNGLDREDIANDLVTQLAERVRRLELARYSTCTFFTSGFPLSPAATGLSVAHISVYPDCGLTVLRNLLFHNPIRTALIVDPMHLPDTETAALRRHLESQSVYVRVLRGDEASVTDVDFHLGQLPYDLIYLAVHGGYPQGARLRVEFLDENGKEHILVILKADSFSVIPNSDKVHVASFYEFESLDGIPWSSPNRGWAGNLNHMIQHFNECILDGTAKIVSSETGIPMKYCNSVRLADDNYYLHFNNVGSIEGAILINNACCSSLQLADLALFGGVNQYVGTTYSVLNPIAQRFAVSTLQSGKSMCRSVSEYNESSATSYGLPCYAYYGLPERRITYCQADNKDYYCSRVTDQLVRTEKYKRDNPFHHLMDRVDMNLIRLRQEIRRVRGNKL